MKQYNFLTNSYEAQGATGAPESRSKPEAQYRLTDPSTSADAAYSVARATVNHRVQVLKALKRFGPGTQEDMAYFTNLRVDQAWRRLSELKNQGFIRDSGKRRVGRSGRKQIIWEVV